MDYGGMNERFVKQSDGEIDVIKTNKNEATSRTSRGNKEVIRERMRKKSFGDGREEQSLDFTQKYDIRLLSIIKQFPKSYI